MASRVQIINQIEKIVKQRYESLLKEEIVFHNYSHTEQVVEIADEIADHYEINEEGRELLLLAAYLLFIGYTDKAHPSEKRSTELAQSILQNLDYPDKDIARVNEIISKVQEEQVSGDFLGEILYDASIWYTGKKIFWEKAELKRIELERTTQKFMSNESWLKNQLDFILQHHFITEYAIKDRQKRRLKNISKLRESLQEIEEGIHARLKKEKNKIPKGIETMYRATYRNHINLSAIADAKANMMISINTIILSVIITLAGAGMTFSTEYLTNNLALVIPVVILLLSTLIAVVFAVLSARPAVTERKIGTREIEQRKSSILFFGNFVSMSLGGFIDALADFRRKEELLYDNMSVDLYYLGKVLTRKYKLLRISYTVFMAGLILSVVVFLSIVITRTLI